MTSSGHSDLQFGKWRQGLQLASGVWLGLLSSRRSRHERPPMHRCGYICPHPFLSLLHTFCSWQTDAARSPTGSRSGGVDGTLAWGRLQGRWSKGLDLVNVEHGREEFMWAPSEEQVMSPRSQVLLCPLGGTARGTQGPDSTAFYNLCWGDCVENSGWHTLANRAGVWAAQIRPLASTRWNMGPGLKGLVLQVGT